MLIVVAITVQHFQKLCKFQVICETVSVSPSHPEQPSIKRQLKGAPKAKGRSSAIRAKFSSAIGRRNNLDKIAHAKKGCPQCICPNSPVVRAYLQTVSEIHISVIFCHIFKTCGTVCGQMMFITIIVKVRC